jgi:hypothetical protein
VLPSLFLGLALTNPCSALATLPAALYLLIEHVILRGNAAVMGARCVIGCDTREADN